MDKSLANFKQNPEAQFLVLVIKQSIGLDETMIGNLEFFVWKEIESYPYFWFFGMNSERQN